MIRLRHLAICSIVLFAVACGTMARGTLLVCKNLSAVDGDTIKCDGINMRDMGDGAPFKSGYDTPEIQNSKCDQEHEKGQDAKARMAELLKTPGIQVYDSGEVDARYKRPLVWVILPNGRSVGSVMIKEGRAKVWTPDYNSDWCN